MGTAKSEKRRIVKMKISINVNDTCNFACKYCYPHLQANTFNEMSDDTAYAILKYCQENKITAVDIPEKEPLYSPPLLVRLIELLSSNGIVVQGVTSNLHNLSVEAIETFVKNNIYVLASFDGVWQDVFRVSKKDTLTYDVVKKNLYSLKGAGVRFGTATVITHANVGNVYENFKHISKITDNIAFNFDVNSSFSIQPSDIPVLRREFKNIASDTLKIFPLAKIEKRLSSKAHYNNHMCGAGRGSYTIDWDGKIYPCYHATAWKKIGLCLGDVWSGVDNAKRVSFRNYDTATPEKCKECESALCGICYTASLDKMGDMCMPIPMNCKIFTMLTEVVKEEMTNVR